MFSVPFYLKAGDFDTLGVIRYSKSRRNKDVFKIHISTGADYEHVADLGMQSEISNYTVVIMWLDMYGYLEDITGAEMMSRVLDINLTKEQAQAILGAGSMLRVW